MLGVTQTGKVSAPTKVTVWERGSQTMPQVITIQGQKCCDGGSTGSCGNTQLERLSQSWKFREGCSEEGAAELGPEV